MLKSKVWIKCTACIFIFTSCFSQNDPDKEIWLTLFNGKDLSDWIIKIKGYPLNENYGNTFQVVDKILQTKYDSYDRFDNRFGHIYYKEKFSYYRLQIEYRFTGEQAPEGPGWAFRNSGIMLHCQDPSTIGLDQDFPISLEAQLLGGNGKDDRPTMNLCTPGTHVKMKGELITQHCISSSSETYHGDQWVQAEVLVLGDSIIHHLVEGETVISYEQPIVAGPNVSGLQPEVKLDNRPLEEGYISLQSESHPVEFRKVQLLNLKGCKDNKAKNYKSYFVKHDAEACIY
jgi:hypothetical protein